MFFSNFKLAGGFLGKESQEEETKTFFTLKQIHSDKIIEIKSPQDFENKKNREGDAIISTLPEAPIAVKTADCVPVLIASKESVIAVVHAGWRGTEQRILEKTLLKLNQKYQIQYSEMQLVIGPAICGACYEVGGEVAVKFQEDAWGTVLKSCASGKYLLDLKSANQQLALNLGIPRKNIESHPDCTRCHSEKYFSYRVYQAQGKSLGNKRNFSWLKFRVQASACKI